MPGRKSKNHGSLLHVSLRGRRRRLVNENPANLCSLHSIAPVSTSTGGSQHQVPPCCQASCCSNPTALGERRHQELPVPEDTTAQPPQGPSHRGGSVGRSPKGRGGLCDAHAPAPASAQKVTDSQGSQLETPARDGFSVCLLFMLIIKEQQMLAACYWRYLHVASFSPASPARRGLPSPGEGWECRTHLLAAWHCKAGAFWDGQEDRHIC